MKWVTRENVHVDRVACPWLIKKFVDTEAEFVFVPADTDPAGITEGIPFDMKGVELGHMGDECSFDAIIHKFKLTSDPALAEVRRIVRLADTGRGQEEPLAQALDLLARGYGYISVNDHETLEKEFVLYDALYAYFQHALEKGAADKSL
ncbi:chromate resistance exported protein [Peptococcaceae bacterium CEB3]|nr:chromate resistance exported protein [Peptococcaceae bacterium CEB3]